MRESLGEKSTSLLEERLEFFDELKRDTYALSEKQFQEVYQDVMTQVGINSPAAVLPKKYAETFPSIFPKLKVRGNAVIIINRDAIPDPSFLEFLIEHECWENYAHKKRGFNLIKYEVGDKKLSMSERSRPEHRLATRKEFRAAEAGGKIDAYMNWWREFYSKDMQRIQELPVNELDKIGGWYTEKNVREAILERIRKNWQLKEAVYKKLKTTKKNLLA